MYTNCSFSRMQFCCSYITFVVKPLIYKKQLKIHIQITYLKELALNKNVYSRVSTYQKKLNLMS